MSPEAQAYWAWQASRVVRVLFIDALFVIATMAVIAGLRPEPHSLAEVVYANAYYQFQAIGAQTAFVVLVAAGICLGVIRSIKALSNHQ